MAFKERTKSKRLRAYEILKQRMPLEKEDYYYGLNHQKGHEGECRYDEMTDNLGSNCIVLNDLQLEVRHSSFQVDTLLLFSHKIFIAEIKNYEGVHQWGKEKFTKLSGATLENPALQLQKTKVRLEMLLQEMGYSIQVDAAVIFVNPEFTLCGAPYDESFILPSQIPEHFRELQKLAAHQPGSKMKNLAEELAKRHIPDYPIKLLDYDYEKLSKGINCPSCGTLAKNYRGHSHICGGCGEKMSIKKAISNSISDFHFLYPDEKMTTKRLADWCSAVNKDRVYTVLKQEWQPVGSEPARYYIPLNEN